MTKLTRRKFVSSSTLAVAGAALPASGLFDASAFAQTPRIRLNAYTDAGRKMLALYAKGVGVMKTRAAGDPTSWTFQWYTHWVPGPNPDNKTKDEMIAKLRPDQRPAANAMWNTCQGHGDREMRKATLRFFLPWHRMQVYYFEQIVRDACGDDSFTLPYWDYLAEGQKAIPPEFRDPKSPLYFANRRPETASWGPAVNDGGSVPVSGETYDCLKQGNYYDPEKPNFSAVIDENPHGLIHDDIGVATTPEDWARRGMSFIPTAAEDPIFFIHHCNIDRAWASWNVRYPNPTTTDWLDKTFTFASPNRTTAEYLVRDYNTTEQLRYRYERLIPLPPRAPSNTVLAARFNAGPATVGTGAVPTLGSEPVQVALVSAAPSALTLSAEMKGFPTGSRYYVVVEGLSADGPPGVHYRIYLGAPASAKGAALERYYVGTPSFFEAAGMGSMPGMEGGTPISFDATNIVARIPANERDNLQVTLIPTGAPVAGSKPAIAKISLIAD
jgi:tyrosinase